MQYRPSNVTPAYWTRVQEFAREAVLDFGPPNVPVGLRMLSVVTHFIIWATNEEHVGLDRAELFHPTILGRYIRMRAPKKQSSVNKTLHSLLFRVASAVADVDHNRKHRGRISHGVIPYTAAELAELESWAIARKNATHRRYAKTFLALAGGAGLQSVECTHVRGRDIIRTDAGYAVRVTGRYPRTVPIQSEWTSYIDEAIGSLTDDEHVLFPSDTDEVRPRTLKWFCVGGHPAPFAQRLRDTWVLSQLPVLPLGVLLHAAGMPDIQTLRRYLERIADTDLTDWDDVLRRPSEHIRPPAADRERVARPRTARQDVGKADRLRAPDDRGAEALRRGETTLRLDQTAVPAGTPQSSVPRSVPHAGSENSSLEPEAVSMSGLTRAGVRAESTATSLPVWTRRASTSGSATFTELKEQLQKRRDERNGGDLR